MACNAVQMVTVKSYCTDTTAGIFNPGAFLPGGQCNTITSHVSFSVNCGANSISIYSDNNCTSLNATASLNTCQQVGFLTLASFRISLQCEEVTPPLICSKLFYVPNCTGTNFVSSFARTDGCTNTTNGNSYKYVVNGTTSWGEVVYDSKTCNSTLASSNVLQVALNNCTSTSTRSIIYVLSNDGGAPLTASLLLLLIAGVGFLTTLH